LEKLGSNIPSDVLFSLSWLATHRPNLLAEQYDALLHHPSETVRRQTLLTIADSGEAYDPIALYRLAQRDESPANRKLCSQIACQQNDLAESQVLAFLNSDDLSTVQGGIIGCKKSGRFTSLTNATLRYLSESEFEKDQLAALDSIQELGEAGYQSFIVQSLSGSSFAITEKAIAVAASQPTPESCQKMLQLTSDRTYDKQAIMGLLLAGALGDSGIQQTIEEGKPHLIHFIAIGCERFRTPRTLGLLIQLLGSERLRTRTAALRSLSRIDPPRDQMADLSDYLQQEFNYLYQLLGGLAENISPSLNASLDFEIDDSIRRIFFLLMLTHDAPMVENAMLNIEHSSREKRANAVEILDNIIPRNEYLALHALLEEGTPAEKRAVFEKTVCRQQQSIPILDYILAQGTTKFSEWSVVQALAAVPNDYDQTTLVHYYDHADPLVRESALQKGIELNLTISQENMSHEKISVGVVSPLEKVMVLKRSPLFENTPENVLSAIVPIITEHTCELGEVLFEKGELGTCMYVIYSGTVEIFDGKTKLAQFGANDIFGELALLDAETRSASAVIADPTLLFRIDQEDFYDLMEERSELLKSVLSILCKRIRMQNDRLRRMEKAN
ncbi:cyclic nucleotide-binding domain-containing protein, partial [Persicitalea sp.]|uniref:cyclic nucleotide-binding domain-containing protein n=1 Tax=Persicitalea sp. TaxID=3100273 RepID=UPI003593C2EE